MTDETRDAVAQAMCAVEVRSKAASLEEVHAGIQRWTRHRYEAERLLEELADGGFEVRAPAPPAADEREAVRNLIEPAVWAWFNAHNSPWSPSDRTMLALSAPLSGEIVGALRPRGTDTAAFADYVDRLGVDANEDHDGEWWDGYRQAQRDNLRRATLELEAALSSDSDIPGGCVNCSSSGVVEDFDGDSPCSACDGTGTPRRRVSADERSAINAALAESLPLWTEAVEDARKHILTVVAASLSRLPRS